MPKVSLKIMSGDAEGVVHEFDEKSSIRIGRSNHNDIILQNDNTVSKEHALIHWEHGEWRLQDLNSKNGIYIEGTGTLGINRRIRRDVTLNGGQLFRIGKTWLRFQTVGWATAKA